ncbi:hypothetical protein [Nostoc sp.]|uniref:hypothetical protein n=1 Tax=Nostoc sp. TaxID=1180 RepID=UPI002FFD5567
MCNQIVCLPKMLPRNQWVASAQIAAKINPFGGESKTFTADTPYVGDDFNDETSSLVIELVS